jgi:hypothetical protein
MGFYDLPKEKRQQVVLALKEVVEADLNQGMHNHIVHYASDEDTYIRKNTYLVIGRYYQLHPKKRKNVRNVIAVLLKSPNEHVRQSMIYTLGEIGKQNAEDILGLLEQGLNDAHHSVRNATIGALKQMGEKNPVPTLKFAKQFLHHPNPEIRREIIHGIELHGRTHPEDVLPLLAEMQHDDDRKVQSYVVHVMAQISYKKGCLEKVVDSLKTWNNKDIVKKIIEEILDVHKRYAKFSEKNPKDAQEHIKKNLQ